MARIGFIGLGHMGLPMAINLVKAGHMVTGFDLNAGALKALVGAGGHAAISSQAAGRAQDIMITMLQTGEQVREVCLGETGLFAAADPHCLYIDCSSIDVESARTLHKEAKKHHLLVVDAPVSGGVAGATAGTLTFMIGGTLEAFQHAQIILSQLGKKIIHTGKAGSGQAAKICNNMILGISMIAISESFKLAEGLGLSAEKLFEVVNSSSGQCWAMTNYPPVPGLVEKAPANHDYAPGFTAAMMLKDLRLSQTSAKAVAIKTPVGALATNLYQEMNEAGMANLDFSAIIKNM